MLVIVVAWRELRPAAVERRRQAMLEVLDPGRAPVARGERIGVVGGASVGRAAGNDVRFDEDSVSSRHALISVTGGRWWLEDLGSTNGSFVNDARVTGRAPLRNGDVVQVGLVSVRFLVRS
jgi:pSer/pThr/pTyr-binding forkhead associated (FHA) protein